MTQSTFVNKNIEGREKCEIRKLFNGRLVSSRYIFIHIDLLTVARIPGEATTRTRDGTARDAPMDAPRQHHHVIRRRATDLDRPPSA